MTGSSVSGMGMSKFWAATWTSSWALVSAAEGWSCSAACVWAGGVVSWAGADATLSDPLEAALPQPLKVPRSMATASNPVIIFFICFTLPCKFRIIL